MSDKVKKIGVKLGFYHPRDSVPARLSDGRIIEVGKDGVELDETLVSDEMRECGLFEIGPAGKTQQTQATDPQEQEPVKETAAQRKAREKAEKEAAEQAGDHEQDAHATE